MEASTEIMNDTIDIKIPTDFKLEKYNSGDDAIVGTGDMEGFDITAEVYDSNSDVEGENLAISQARVDLYSGKNLKQLNLSDFPEFEGKYQAYFTSDYDTYKKYVLTKADGSEVSKFTVQIPNDKITPENEALVRAIAASVEF